MIPFAKQLEMDKYHGMIVAYNGAYVLDVTTQKELFSQPIPTETSKAILEHLKHFDVIPMIAKDDYMYVNNVFNGYLTITSGKEPVNIIEYESRGGNFSLCEKKDLAAFVDFPLHKILIAGDPSYLQKNWQKILAPFNNIASGLFSAPMYFEFTDRGIDKANALEQVLVPKGIHSNELIAFGDGQNDLTLIKYAGIGVAMGNAVAELKQAATNITLSNNEDGIAITLNKLL
jgi:Cof subfamily protein (haloacid dehalogenase superfamily)